MKKWIVILLAMVLTMSLVLVACDDSSASLTIKFDTQGGSTLADVVVDKDNEFSAPSDPTREGYTFAGWFTDKEGTTEWTFDSTATGTVTVYALWVEDKFVINTAQDLVEYLSSEYTQGDKVYLEGNIDLADAEMTDVYSKKAYLVLERDIVLTGLDDATITTGEYVGNDIIISVEDCAVTISNISFEYTSYTALAIGTGAQAIVDGCTFDSDSMDNTQKTIHTYGGAVVTIRDCTFGNLAGYGSQSISSYDSHVTVERCTFDNVTQAVMAQKTSNEDYTSSLTVQDSTFANVDYAIFTISGGQVDVTVDNCTMDEVAVFVANNSGTFTITNNTFVVGERTLSDANFKNTTGVDMIIDNTNTIVGEATFGTNVVYDTTNAD